MSLTPTQHGVSVTSTEPMQVQDLYSQGRYAPDNPEIMEGRVLVRFWPELKLTLGMASHCGCITEQEAISCDSYKIPLGSEGSASLALIAAGSYGLPRQCGYRVRIIIAD